MNPCLFLRHALQRPGTAGALLPSSPNLARALTRHAHHASLLLELGAGTGAVTRELRATLRQTPLIAIEAQPDMASHLRASFPDVDVRTQWAHEALDDLMTTAPAHTVVVSSLPFRSLPAAVRDTTIESLCRFLHGDASRRLVQYTYQPRVPFALPLARGGRTLHWTRACTVWRNTPPAGVWVLA